MGRTSYWSPTELNCLAFEKNRVFVRILSTEKGQRTTGETDGWTNIWTTSMRKGALAVASGALTDKTGS